MKSENMKMSYFLNGNMNSSDEKKQSIFDQAKRSFIIPQYQREYTWEEDKITTLINDIKTRDKFLGIIILDKTANGYEIVDGQQRITTIVLALICLYNLYKDEHLTQEMILTYLKNEENEYVLKNDSIGDYIKEEGNLLSIHITPEADIYYQKTIFKNAYDIIYHNLSKLKEEDHNKSENNLIVFFNKLCDCEFVVLINEAQSQTHPVEQIFLDINEKSQLLDVENIFKGHCFKNFGNHHVKELRNLWINLKKCGANFSKINYKNLSEYIYLFLLNKDGAGIKKNLYDNGRHYLEGKNIDQTNRLLNDMIQYGNSVYNFYTELKDSDYKFGDLCKKESVNNSTVNLLKLKKMLLKLLETKTQYHKLPLMYFIYQFNREPELSKLLTYYDLWIVFTDLFIYGMIFLCSSGRKGKDNIDFSLRDTLRKDGVTKTEILRAARNLRKNSANLFQIIPEKKEENYIAFLSAVIDNYNADKKILDTDYFSGDYNLEHLIIMQNKNRVITWMHNAPKGSFSFSVNKEDARKYASFFGNYLWIPRDLNGELNQYDIVYKIKHIKEWYSKENRALPPYVNCMIENITKLNSYADLASLKETNVTDEKMIEKAYYCFLKEYFDNDNQQKLALSIQSQFRMTF